jgi:hypothetical protein
MTIERPMFPPVDPTRQALAQVRKRKARERLRHDGSDSIPAMQRRIQALAVERSIPLAEIAKLMRKRVGTQDVAFCKKHKISVDWLLCGDLLSMARDAPRSRPVLTPDEFVRALKQLDPGARAAITEYVRILAAKVTP